MPRHEPAAVAADAPHAIPIRRPGFDFSKMSRHWFDGDAYSTHIMNAFSLTLPLGERFFIESVRQHLDAIKSPALRTDVSHFFAQESMHGQLHEGLNEWIRAQGFVTREIEADAQARLDNLRAKFSPKIQLAITMAWEHFTAILSDYVLGNAPLRESWERGARDLWEWHALEEMEHRAVPFDVYREAGGGYFIRAITMLFVTVKYIPTIARYRDQLLAQEPVAISEEQRRAGSRRFWISPGYLRRVFPAWLAYFRPGFHPSQRAAPAAFDEVRRRFEDSVVRSDGATSRAK